MNILITGKIASGKSEALKILENEGFIAIDADKVVHDLYKVDCKGYKRIFSVFGEKYFSGDCVDRKRLLQALLSGEVLLSDLENLIQPLVYDVINNKVANTKNNVAIELVNPNLYELNFIVDHIFWIDRNINLIKKELVSRGYIAREINYLIGLQKRVPGSIVIENNDGLSELKYAIRRLIK